MNKMAQWHTRNGVSFLVSTEDLHWVIKHNWHLSKRGYITTKINRKNVCLHKMILEVDVGFDIDHINGNKLDNQRENLRVCTHQQNCFNQKRRSTNTTGFIGVSKKKGMEKFEAYIHYCGKKFYLGLFDSVDEAARIRDRAALEKYGEYARLNFSEERVS